MTIQERYNALLEAQKQQVGEQYRLDSMRKYDEYRRRRREEFPAESLKQAGLIEELRQLGVWQVIEEFTGEHLEIQEENGIAMKYMYRPWGDTLCQLDDQVNETDHMIWTYNVLSPELGDNGIWNPDLRVIIEHIDPSNLFASRGNGVLITYSQDKTFTVEGKEVVFRGLLPNDLEERTELVEGVIARGLVNPYLKGKIPKG